MRLSLILTSWLALAASAAAQNPEDTRRFYPLDHQQPVGRAGRWQATIYPGLSSYSQPVRIALPAEAEVTFYQGSPQAGVATPAPAQAGMQVGYVYRVKIAQMPDYPGVELYPTIELLDRLHPPTELKDKFPIPIELTTAEIETALNDQMVTKVIYLEQPQLATPTRQIDGKMHTEVLQHDINLLEAADRRGRPIAIVRLGGRIPDPQSPQDEFFSTSPLTFTPQP